MTLTPDSRRTLHAAILSAFPDRDSLTRMLDFGLDVNLNVLVGDADLSTVVLKVIRWAEAHGRVEELVAAAVEHNPGNHRLQALKLAWSSDERRSSGAPRPAVDDPIVLHPSHASVPTASPAAASDPFSAHLVRGRRPFLNRYTLREHLKAIASGASEILVVNGPPGSGKSYSAELIFHVAAALGSVRVLYVNAGEEVASPGLGSNRLARQLARHLASDAAEPDEGWSSEAIASRLLDALGRSSERWWIVLDGVDRPGVPPEDADLVRRLMILASAAGVRGSFALVLLGFDMQLVPGELKPYILQDVIAPLEVEHVKEFLRQVLREKNRQVTEHDLVELAASVVRGSPSDLGALAPLLKTLLDRL